jgi:transcriptional regulator with XRE-family HTH domain
MPTRESPIQRGRRLGRTQRRRIGEEFRTTRIGLGMSLREVGRRLGISHSAVARRERGDIESLSIDQIAVMAAVLGLESRLQLYPVATPLRDAAQLALLARFRARLPPELRFRIEVPIPIPGDLRSADGVVDRLRSDPVRPGRNVAAIIEAETRVGDVQVVIRRLRAKQRDLGVERAVLLLSDTRHHRALVAAEPTLRAAFPVSQRVALRALAEGRDPGGDAILLL